MGGLGQYQLPCFLAADSHTSPWDGRYEGPGTLYGVSAEPRWRLTSAGNVDWHENCFICLREVSEL